MIWFQRVSKKKNYNLQVKLSWKSVYSDNLQEEIKMEDMDIRNLHY